MIPSDEELVRRSRDGDPRGVEALVLRYQKSAHAIARAAGVGPDAVEDVVQDAFLGALRGLDALRDPKQFRSWFLAIVRYTARAHLRANRPSETPPELPSKAESPLETLEKLELRDLLWRQVAALPEGIREAIFLYYYEGGSIASAARALGVSRSAVRNRLHKGRELLRGRVWRAMDAAFRETLPGRREWRRRGRTVSLVLLSASARLAVPAQAALSGAGIGVLLWRAATQHAATIGGMTMALKKPVLAALVSIALFGLGGAFVVERMSRPDAEGAPERVVSSLEPSEGGAPSDPPIVLDREPTGASETSPASGAEAEPDAPLCGRVLRADGSPAAGAVVHAVRLKSWLVEGMPEEANWDQEPHETTSDAQGRFRFEDIEDDRWALQARGNGGSFAWKVGVDAPVATLVVLTLEEGYELEGVVVDERGLPVPSATIKIRAADALNYPFSKPALEIAGEADGTFHGVRLPAGSFRLSATAPRHRSEGAETIVLPAEEPVRLVLRRAAVLAGHAYLRDRNHPLRNTRIEFRRRAPHTWGRGRAVTDAHGYFVSSPVHPGNHQVVFFHEPFAPVEVEVDATVEHSPEDLEIVFEEGLSVGGVALARREEPVARSVLEWTAEGSAKAAVRECTTDASGRFRMTGLRGGTYRLLAPGFAADAKRSVLFTLEDSSVTDAVLVFDVPQPISVIVETVTGEGVAGVRVHYVCRSPQASMMRYTLETDASGRTALGALPGAGNVTLNAHHEDLGSARLEVALEDSLPPFRLTLGTFSKSSVVGRVVAADGEPITDAVVRANLPAGFAADSCNTTSAGAFQLTVDPGEYEILVQAGSAGEIRRAFTAVGGETLDLGELRVTSGDLASLRGQVLDPDGAPVGGAEIHVNALGAHETAWLRTDAQGWFSVDVPDGVYSLTAYTDDLRLAEPIEDLRPGTNPLEIWLARVPKWTVAGRVIVDGRPLEGARARYYRLRDGRFNFGDPGIATRPDGEFEFRDVSAPRIIVVAQHPSFAFARSAELTLPAGQDRVDDVVVVPVGGRDLQLRAVTEEGTPVVGASIHLRGRGEPPPEAWGRTDPAGLWSWRRIHASSSRSASRPRNGR